MTIKNMKKYIITTSVALIALSSVYAESGETKTNPLERTGRPVMATSTRPQMNPREGQMMQMMAPTITTGDAATDKQIKALQVEMEAKIKAIRDEYQAKIKAAIGERKATMIAPKMSSSATAEEMRGRGMMMSSSSPRRDGEMMRASSTSYGERYGAPMRRDGDRIPETQEVKGESAGGAVSSGSLNEGGIRGFFGKFFGR